MSEMHLTILRGTKLHEQINTRTCRNRTLFAPDYWLNSQ